jgi:hypothetical protein
MALVFLLIALVYKLIPFVFRAIFGRSASSSSFAGAESPFQQPQNRAFSSLSSITFHLSKLARATTDPRRYVAAQEET